MSLESHPRQPAPSPRAEHSVARGSELRARALAAAEGRQFSCTHSEQPMDASGNIALSMEECCMRSCHSSGFTQESCPDGTVARGEHDYHQPGVGSL